MCLTDTHTHSSVDSSCVCVCRAVTLTAASAPDSHPHARRLLTKTLAAGFRAILSLPAQAQAAPAAHAAAAAVKAGVKGRTQDFRSFSRRTTAHMQATSGRHTDTHTEAHTQSKRQENARGTPSEHRSTCMHDESGILVTG